MAGDGLGDMLQKVGEQQAGMDGMMIFADLVTKTQKRIRVVIAQVLGDATVEALRQRGDLDRVAEALAKDRLDWMMTDMAAVAEKMEGEGEGEGT